MPLSLLLQCRRIDETRHYYETVLGFDVFDSVQGTITATFQNAALIFTEADLWKRPVGLSGTIYFTVDDVDAYFETVRDKADIAWPLQNMSYGSREFAVVDCNGYHVAFQQADPL